MAGERALDLMRLVVRADNPTDRTEARSAGDTEDPLFINRGAWAVLTCPTWPGAEAEVEEARMEGAEAMEGPYSTPLHPGIRPGPEEEAAEAVEVLRQRMLRVEARRATEQMGVQPT